MPYIYFTCPQWVLQLTVSWSLGVLWVLARLLIIMRIFYRRSSRWLINDQAQPNHCHYYELGAWVYTIQEDILQKYWSFPWFSCHLYEIFVLISSPSFPLQAMVIIAWNQSGSLSVIFDADVFKSVLSIFITAAILNALRGSCSTLFDFLSLLKVSFFNLLETLLLEV